MSDVATKRGPYAATKRRREEVARAVLDIVDASGHESVTLAAVAERASISEATLLYHFPSKDHLLVAALRLSDDEVSSASHVDDAEVTFSLDDFRRLIETDSRDDPRLRLLRFLSGAAQTAEHPASAYLAERMARQVHIFTKLVASRQRAGVAHPGLDPHRTAVQLIAVWEGLTTMWLGDRDLEIADLLIDAYRRLAGENVMEARAMLRDAEFGL